MQPEPPPPHQTPISAPAMPTSVNPPSTRSPDPATAPPIAPATAPTSTQVPSSTTDPQHNLNTPAAPAGPHHAWEPSPALTPTPIVLAKQHSHNGDVELGDVSKGDSVGSGDKTELKELQHLPGHQPPPFFKPYLNAKNLVVVVGALILIWSFAWMYVGFSWSPLTRLKNLHIAVLVCDQGAPPASAVNATFAPLLPSLVPQPLATTLLQGSLYNPSSAVSRSFWWQDYPCDCSHLTASGEPLCLQELRHDIYEGGAWAGLYFPTAFTTSYLSWFGTSGLAPPRAPISLTLIYARGRDYTTYSYITTGLLQNILPAISRSFTQGLAGNANVAGLLPPAFFATGLTVQAEDLAPVNNFGQSLATYIFCILLWLGSSFVVSISHQYKMPAEIRMLDPRVQDKPSSWHLAGDLLVKSLGAIVFMFLESVLLCVVLWALGGGNEQWHYSAGYAIAFGWYMSWSFISVNAVLLHLTGVERFSSITAMLLILQLTSGSAIFSSELSNRFFQIGKGLPFYYGVRGFRTIFFGSLDSKMYINWLVLTAYNVVLGPLGLWFVTRHIWLTGSGGTANTSGAVVGEVALPAVGF